MEPEGAMPNSQSISNNPGKKKIKVDILFAIGWTRTKDEWRKNNKKVTTN